jgi:Bacterial PH domain
VVDDPDDGAHPRAWAAPVGAVVLGLVAAVGLAAWAVAVSDPPGRLLVGIAALALAGASLVGAIARPRLRADDEGLVLRGALGARHWPWERVDAVRVVRMRRMGLPAAYVEVDARDAGHGGDDDATTEGGPGRERLLVLGRLELGADPVDVAEALQYHRAAAGRRRAGPASGEQQDLDEDEHEQDSGDDPGEDEPHGRT